MLLLDLGVRAKSSLLSLVVVLAVIYVTPVIAQDLPSRTGSVQRTEGGGPKDIQSLAGSSSLIIRGRIFRRESRFVGRVIFTFYDISVQEMLKGTPRSTVSVAVPGGEAGNVQLIIPTAPEMSIGDELVLFGQAFSADSATFQPTGVVDGLIPILRTPNGGLTVAPRSEPEELEQFLQEVRAMRDRR